MPSDEILRQRLRTALTAAMKARDMAAVRALRSALAAIDNAESIDASHARRPEGGLIAGSVSGLGAGDVPRRALSSGQVADIVRSVIDDWQTAAAEYDRLGRRDQATLLRAEAAVLVAHLTTD